MERFGGGDEVLVALAPRLYVTLYVTLPGEIIFYGPVHIQRRTCFLETCGDGGRLAQLRQPAVMYS